MLRHCNNLFIAIGRNRQLLRMLPSHPHIIIDYFRRHLYIIQHPVGRINDRYLKIIGIQLYVYRLHRFPCKIVRSVRRQIPVINLPAHIGPAGINLPDHHAGSYIPHPMIGCLKHSTITVSTQELGIIGIFFRRLRITKHRADGIVIRTVAIITHIPGAMFRPNAIQREDGAVYIGCTLCGRNKFPETVVHRHRRHTQFIAEHLQINLTYFIEEVRGRRPVIVGCTVIRGSGGQVFLQIGSQSIHIPVVTGGRDVYTCSIKALHFLFRQPV